MLNAWRGGARVEYINACFCRAVAAGGSALSALFTLVRHVICRDETAVLQSSEKVSSQSSVAESFEFVSLFGCMRF